MVVVEAVVLLLKPSLNEVAKQCDCRENVSSECREEHHRKDGPTSSLRPVSNGAERQGEAGLRFAIGTTGSDGDPNHRQILGCTPHGMASSH